MTPPTIPSRPWLDDLEGALLEGVIWDAAAGQLLFVDLPRGLLYATTPGPDGSAGPVTRLDLPAPVTAVHPTTADRTLLIADGEGVALVRHGGPEGPRVERLAAPLADHPELRMNDGAVSPEGRYFAGSMAYDERPGAGTLYRLDADRSLHTVFSDVTVSNGIDWSPDGTLCYYADTPLDRVDVVRHDPATGALTGRRPFVDTTDLPGKPDGLTVDAEGYVWVAFWGGGQVCRFAPDGTLHSTVPVAADQVTSCAFGGPDLDRLFITTAAQGLDDAARAEQPAAGRLLVAEPGVKGRPATPFSV